MVIRDLIVKLGFQVNNAQIQTAERSIDRVKSQATVLGSTLRNAFAGFAAFQGVRQIVQLGDDMQSMRARIGMLPQTLGDAGDALDEVGRRASASGMSIDAYGKLYARVGNAAKDYITTQEDLLGITDTISKALVVGGASTAEASSVMLQFSQALASGVLQGDEFRSMAEAAPQYLDQLSLAMNIPREQLKKMASEGKLTAKEVIEATRKMSRYFETRFQDMPLTVGRATTIVANKWSLMIDKINRESSFITSIANIIVGALEIIEDGITYLSDVVGGNGNLIRLAIIAVSLAITYFLLPALSTMAIAINAAIWPITLITAAILALTLILDDLYVWVKGGDSVIGSFVGTWADASASIKNDWQGLKDWFGGVFTWFENKFAAIGNFFKGIMNGARELGEFLGLTGESPQLTQPTSVRPAQLGGTAGGNSSNTLNKTTNVSVTVPPGTSAEQAAFLERSAKQVYAVDNSNTGDIEVVGA